MAKKSTLKPKTIVTARQRSMFGDSLVEQRHAEAFDADDDIRTQLWAEGRAAIRKLTGKSHVQAGVIIGQLLKDGRDDCAMVLNVMREALDLRPVEPLPWIYKAVRSRARDMTAASRIASDWDLVGPMDLDANAALLMARSMGGQDGGGDAGAPMLEYDGYDQQAG